MFTDAIEFDKQVRPTIGNPNDTFLRPAPLLGLDCLRRVLTEDEIRDDWFVWMLLTLEHSPPAKIYYIKKNNRQVTEFLDVFHKLRQGDLICPGPFQEWLHPKFVESFCAFVPFGFLRVMRDNYPDEHLKGETFIYEQRMRIFEITSFNWLHRVNLNLPELP